MAIAQSVSFNFIPNLPVKAKQSVQYPFYLWYNQDYYRSISAILRIKNESPTIYQQAGLDYLSVANYYHLHQKDKALSIAKTILKKPALPKDRQIRIALAKWSACRLLVDQQDKQALSVWTNAGLPDAETFPVTKQVQGLVSVRRAKIYSMIIPGSGFLVSHSYWKAIGSFTLNASFIAGGYYLGTHKQVMGAVVLLFFATGWYKGSMNASVEAAQNYNQTIKKEYREEWFRSYSDSTKGVHCE